MTTFLFVRHGEPDYSSVGEWSQTPMGTNFAGLTEEGVAQIKKSCVALKEYPVELIISSPYTRALQSAAIMAGELHVDVVVERNLHEWQVDLTYSLTDSNDLLELCHERDRMNGEYPVDETRCWESTELVRCRVLDCLKKYLDRKCVVVAGHAIMMQAILDISDPLEYGEIRVMEVADK
ncbi:MAG: histidine phosphatase family protein [Lachnospiraceae bacterium]|nr:histidine phosphatase family protein [Lachnospiraceae bacterium]